MKKLLYYTLITTLFCYGTLSAQEWQTSGNKIYNTNAGNVGIGTINPNTNLEVYKFAGTSQIRLHTDQHNGLAKLEISGGSAFLDNDPNNYSGWSIYHSHNQTNRDLYFRHGETGEPNVTFTDNGYVGIGTNNPAVDFEVYKFDGTSQIRLHTNQHNGLAKLELSGGSAFLDADPNNYSGWSIYHSYNQTNRDLYFRHGETGEPNVTFTDNGNVGIGTTDLDAKLAVKGDIHAQEVRVDLNGAVAPDYVFEPDYNLRSLEETEAYIKANKHLPEIPPAAEMEKNGFELKEMNLKLLQKIEELTLYTIEQEKRINRLELKNQKLEAENILLKSLSKRLARLEKQVQSKN